MPNLYTINSKNETSESFLTNGEKFSVIYHSLFDYPLSFSDMIRWRASEGVGNRDIDNLIASKNGYFYLDGKDHLIYKRVLRHRISVQKIKIAKNAAGILSYIPGVKMIAVTGSLAMDNSDDGGDIDIMVITKKNTLWTTRIFAYLLICLFGIQRRYPNDRIQKDRLCLNMWLDENDMVWKERNLYTAHEIAQIIPLISKNLTYEKFLLLNKWILGYWPNSVKIRQRSWLFNPKSETPNKFKFPKFKYLNIVSNFVLRTSNLIAFKIQYAYMKNKISREVITPTRALFHPQDWGKVVLDRLNIQS